MCKTVGCNAKPRPNFCFCENCWNKMLASLRNFSPSQWTGPKPGPDARANRVGPRAGKANQPLHPLMKQPSSYGHDDL